MSKGAMSELFKASLEKFSRLIKNVPRSEKKEILKILQERYDLLEKL